MCKKKEKERKVCGRGKKGKYIKSERNFLRLKRVENEKKRINDELSCVRERERERESERERERERERITVMY